MSLLTEEQIAELIGIASNQSTSKDLYEEFHEWNRKQTTFLVDWNEAPEDAVQAIINTFWVNKNGVTFGVYKTYYDRPKPVITPHPHAEMIMKYAEVAQRRFDPWVEFEWADIRVAYSWQKMTCTPDFNLAEKYRHIGETK
jgi:hypothetical protein